MLWGAITWWLIVLVWTWFKMRLLLRWIRILIVLWSSRFRAPLWISWNLLTCNHYLMTRNEGRGLFLYRLGSGGSVRKICMRRWVGKVCLRRLIVVILGGKIRKEWFIFPRLWGARSSLQGLWFMWWWNCFTSPPVGLYGHLSFCSSCPAQFCLLSWSLELQIQST